MLDLWSRFSFLISNVIFLILTYNICKDSSPFVLQTRWSSFEIFRRYKADTLWILEACNSKGQGFNSCKRKKLLLSCDADRSRSVGRCGVEGSNCNPLREHATGVSYAKGNVRWIISCAQWPTSAILIVILSYLRLHIIWILYNVYAFVWSHIYFILYKILNVHLFIYIYVFIHLS